MPLKSKKKNANGSENKSSTIKAIFRRYNPDKVTANGIRNFLGYIFYKTGYEIEMSTVYVWNKVSKVFDRLYKFTSGLLKNMALFFDKLTDTILDDLGEPLERIGRAVSAISTISKEAKTDKNRSARKEMSAYMKEGMAKHKDLARTLYSYICPLAAAAVFALVVSFALGREYAIQVNVGGENIGTVSNYSVLENANKIIENKLVSTDGQEWTLDASIKMVGQGRKEILDERRLANNILATSDEDIVEASGLYVNGEFRGAVQDATLLNKALHELKEPYENGSESRTVSFVEDVNVLEGIFFTDSVVGDKELADMVGSEVSGEKRYTVVSGDSPWTIAKKNGITTSTLYALNPENDFKGLWPGDELVVGASVPFLQVKYVETSTRDVEVAYKIKTEKNNSMALGTSKTSQKGQKGINRQTVESTYIDGILQSEIVTNTEVIKEPVTEIVQQGTLYNGQVITGGSGKLIWPTGGGRISRGFTGQYPAYHNGLDIAAPIGTHIYAADSGVVTRALYTNVGYGIYCIIEHGGYQTLYGHCSRLFVSRGQQVKKGDLIAYMGSTGNSTGPHLHFEVKNGNYRYNPMSWF